MVEHEIHHRALDSLTQIAIRELTSKSAYIFNLMDKIEYDNMFIFTNLITLATSI